MAAAGGEGPGEGIRGGRGRQTVGLVRNLAQPRPGRMQGASGWLPHNTGGDRDIQGRPPPAGSACVGSVMTSSIDNEFRVDLLSDITDLNSVRSLIADMHDDLTGRVQRFRYLADLARSLALPEPCCSEVRRHSTRGARSDRPSSTATMSQSSFSAEPLWKSCSPHSCTLACLPTICRPAFHSRRD